MKKTLAALISITAFSIPVFANDDEHPNPIKEPIEFIGNVFENTASTVTGAVVGTGQALGDMAESAGEEDENED